MFLKPMKIKANTQLKMSEKRAFRASVQSSFPFLSENFIEHILGSKSILSVLKVLTHSSKNVNIYICDKRPIFFLYRDTLYPTLQLMWEIKTEFLYMVTTFTNVLNRLKTGANLMVPGILTPEIDGPEKYGNMTYGQVVCINLNKNKAPVAVGIASMSAAEMVKEGCGKCVNVLHIEGDNLFTLDNCLPISKPDLGPPDFCLMSKNIESESAEDDISSETTLISTEGSTNSVEDAAPITAEEDDPVKKMDELFNYCFLKCLRCNEKKIVLPLLTSNVFRLMTDVCPLDKKLDLRISSYKKFGQFLQIQVEVGLITLVEQAKGVHFITSINFRNEILRSFVLSPNDVILPTPIGELPKGPQVSEDYLVTAAVLPIFEKFGFRKGDYIKHQQFLKYITDYVKLNELQNKSDSRFIIPDSTLSNVVHTQNPLTWVDLMDNLSYQMTSCFKVTSAEGKQVSGKGKLNPITFSVARRSGNKKVTLVDNLEVYGIDVVKFAKECQIGVAASCSVTKPAGSKFSQLLVQGNQVAYVGDLLTGKYKIPKKYIKGLELAPKKK